MKKEAKNITMKMKLLLPALLFCGSTAHAGRAFEDAVWEHIGKSDNHFADLDRQINNLNATNTSLNQHIAQISKDIETLKTAKTGLHYLGEQYRGGVIFYLDKSGQHGLIASLMDAINEGVQWRNGASGNKVTNAQGDGIGAGETNTRLIISQQTSDKQNGKFAALLAANFQILEDGTTPCKTPAESETVCYGGWYLPSAYELQLLYAASHNNPSLSLVSDFYWSSTEASVNKAWIQNIATGEMTTEVKSNNNGHVRAINRF